jgi:tyrosyl-tRNA synthetase
MTINEALTRRAQDIIPTKQALEKLLKSGKKIRLYQGFDPSSPNLHIGHLVGLLQLKSFQDLGHEVIFLIGDFTGMIGDPTDKSATRKKLTSKQVQVNALTYKQQAGKILNFKGKNPAQMKFNSKWLSKLKLEDILELASNFTVQQLIERDMFQKRLNDNQPVYLHEFIYPMMVTYDAIEMKVDLEVGGNDQLFNMIIGRHLIKEKINKDKFVLTTKLLTDDKGLKIGKSTGNAINFFDNPNTLFGQIMALPDATTIPAFKLATTLPMEVIKEFEKEIKQKPMKLKKRLAFEIIKLCHGDKEAQKAQQHFEATFQQKAPKYLKTVKNQRELLTTISQVLPSNSQAKRLILDGAVDINDQTVKSFNHQTKIGDKVKIGKKTFIKII